MVLIHLIDDLDGLFCTFETFLDDLDGLRYACSLCRRRGEENGPKQENLEVEIS